MNRLQELAIHWARSAAAVPVARSGCSICHSRKFSSSRLTRKEDESERDAGSTSETKSALDEIFDGLDAFDHDQSSTENTTRKAQSPLSTKQKQKQKVPRDVLMSTFDSEEYTSQLNQDWDGKGEEGRGGGKPSYRPFSSPSGSFKSNFAVKKKSWRGTMTPGESKVFEEIFSSMFYGSDTKSRDVEMLNDDGLFGSTLGNESNEQLKDYKTRAMKNWDKEQKRTAQKKRGLAASLNEGITSEGVSEEELEAKIDEARIEIVACQTLADTWQWAAKNVWGADQEEYLEREAIKALEEEERIELSQGKEEGKLRGDGLEEEQKIKTVSVQSQDDGATSNMKGDESETSDNDVAPAEMTTSSSSSSDKFEAEPEAKPLNTIPSARFGISTPYYAPVISLLLVHLREVFKSPQAALSVLRMTKNIGPDSFVLGCTPQLYAQALKTRWIILKDLQGSRDILQEARDVGMLDTRTNLTAAWDNRITPEQGSKKGDETDDDLVRDVFTKTIKHEARQHVIDGITFLGTTQTPQAYIHQLGLVAQMDRLLGKTNLHSRRGKQQRPSNFV